MTTKHGEPPQAYLDWMKSAYPDLDATIYWDEGDDGAVWRAAVAATREEDARVVEEYSVPCGCGPAWRDRGMHAPECQHEDWIDAAAAIREKAKEI